MGAPESSRQPPGRLLSQPRPVGLQQHPTNLPASSCLSPGHGGSRVIPPTSRPPPVSAQAMGAPESSHQPPGLLLSQPRPWGLQSHPTNLPASSCLSPGHGGFRVIPPTSRPPPVSAQAVGLQSHPANLPASSCLSPGRGASESSRQPPGLLLSQPRPWGSSVILPTSQSTQCYSTCPRRDYDPGWKEDK
uniref:Uncharacterized protein n=1 Tax=Molossus molossus TaxID=27622 RepID=A0A7J8HHY2_MOLMO|nr:hypothetical protein HJG59_010926 [Molossus molossus]